jgi:hypothetical protein
MYSWRRGTQQSCDANLSECDAQGTQQPAPAQDFILSCKARRVGGVEAPTEADANRY